MLSMSGSVTGSVDVLAELAAIMDYNADLEPVRAKVEDAIREGNRRDRMAGVDVRGDQLIPLAPSTLKQRNGSPTPFVEHGDASTIIAGLSVDVLIGPGSMIASLFWPGVTWLEFHRYGRGRNPLRDVAGISLATMYDVDRIVIAEADRQFAAAVTQGRALRGVDDSGNEARFIL